MRSILGRGEVTQYSNCQQDQIMQAIYNHDNNVLDNKTFTKTINIVSNQTAIGTLITDQPYTLSCSKGTLNAANKTCTYTYTRSANSTCPSGYNNYNSTSCYKIIYRDSTGTSCPSGYRNTSSGCYKSVSKVKTTTCDSGYTYGKWGSGRCTDSAAFTTSQGRDCGNGTTSWWDGIHYICTFKSPHSYSSPYTCPADTSGSYCVDFSNSRAYEYSCSSGYSWNGSKCTKTKIVNKVYSCSSGYSLSGSSCSQLRTISATFNCPSGFTYNSTDDICKKD